MKLDLGTARIGQYDAATAVPALLASLDFGATQPAAFAEVWQHVVDGLTEQVALLD